MWIINHRFVPGEDSNSLGGFSVFKAVFLEIVLASETFQVLCTTTVTEAVFFITFVRDGCHQEETGDCW